MTEHESREDRERQEHHEAGSEKGGQRERRVQGEYQPVQPIEQVTILLFGSPVRAVRLPDGRIAAVFNDLTDALGLYNASQAHRVRADEVTVDQLFLADIVDDNAGGAIVPMAVLTAWAIPIWLTGIQLTRVAPAKRPTILAFKREAADVLYKHFSQPREAPQPGDGVNVPALPAPAESVPAPLAQPDKPAPDAGRSAWIEYYQAMAAWLEWQDDMERWRAESDARAMQLRERQDVMEARQGQLDTRQDLLEDRMEGVEELSRLFVDVALQYCEVLAVWPSLRSSSLPLTRTGTQRPTAMPLQ